MPLHPDQIELFNKRFNRWKWKPQFLTLPSYLSEKLENNINILKIILFCLSLFFIIYLANQQLTPLSVTNLVLNTTEKYTNISKDELQASTFTKNSSLTINKLNWKQPDEPEKGNAFEYFSLNKIKLTPFQYNLFKQSTTAQEALLYNGDIQFAFHDEEEASQLQTYRMVRQVLTRMTAKVTSTNLSWGYSNYTKGAINDAHFTLTPDQHRPTFTLHSGVFEQNFLKDLEVKSGQIICEPDQILFEDIHLETPYIHSSLSGSIQINNHMPVDMHMNLHTLDLAYFHEYFGFNFLSGSVTGKVHISGDLNSNSGLVYKGSVSIPKEAKLIFKNESPIVYQITTVSKLPTQNKIVFTEGNFDFQVDKNICTIENISLSSTHNQLAGSTLIYRKENSLLQTEINTDYCKDSYISSNLTYKLAPHILLHGNYQDRFELKNNMNCLSINIEENLQLGIQNFADRFVLTR